MRRLRVFLLFVAACSVLLLSGSGETAEQKPAGKGEGQKPGLGKPFGLATSRSPIDVNSDTAEGDQKKNLFIFKGNVIARQDDITLYANIATIQYDPESKGVKTVVATGNVKIVQQNRRATCQRISFQQDENKVILEGDVVIREGDNVIRGERVIYYINEERSVVEGGKGGRVNTTITPPQKE